MEAYPRMSLKVVAEDMKTNACSVVVDNVRDPEVEAGEGCKEVHCRRWQSPVDASLSLSPLYQICQSFLRIADCGRVPVFLLWFYGVESAFDIPILNIQSSKLSLGGNEKAHCTVRGCTTCPPPPLSVLLFFLQHYLDASIHIPLGILVWQSSLHSNTK